MILDIVFQETLDVRIKVPHTPHDWKDYESSRHEKRVA